MSCLTRGGCCVICLSTMFAFSDHLINGTKGKKCFRGPGGRWCTCASSVKYFSLHRWWWSTCRRRCRCVFPLLPSTCYHSDWWVISWVPFFPIVSDVWLTVFQAIVSNGFFSACIFIPSMSDVWQTVFWAIVSGGFFSACICFPSFSDVWQTVFWAFGIDGFFSACIFSPRFSDVWQTVFEQS